MDRLTSMSVFVKAVDLGSFTAAGVALGLSSQMVGKHVVSLEERLGVELLRRSTRRQSLTASGRAYYDRCRVVLAEVDGAEAMARDLSSALRGHLRISAPVTFGAVALAPLVAEYVKANALTEITLDLTDRYVDIVGEGFDAAIRLGPLQNSGLMSRTLRPYKLIACASPAYLKAHGTPRTPGDLAGHECLGFVYASGQAFSEWPFAQGGQQHDIQVRSRFQVNDARVLRDAALRGHGIILQADLIVAEDIAAARLVQVLPDYETPARPLHILFSGSRPPTQILREFIDRLVTRFGP